MPPLQKTFELIPNALGSGLGRPGFGHDASARGNSPLARPPMTSKQAKKLYKEANKAPKMSKAEQRRVELMEQDRIRKELDKEKAQARARTARDRRKAKEEAQREAKKKKGLPLIDVRPSQDTIARFVRGNGTGKKRDSAGAELQVRPCLQTVEEEDKTDDPSDKENEEPRGLPESARASGSPGFKAASASSQRSLDGKHSQSEVIPVSEAIVSLQPEDVELREPKTASHAEPVNSGRSKSCSVPADEEQAGHAEHNQYRTSCSNSAKSGATSSPATHIPTAQVKDITPSRVNSQVRVLRERTPFAATVAQETPPAQLAIAPEVLYISTNSASAVDPVHTSRPDAKLAGMGPPPVPPRFRSPVCKQVNAAQRPKFLPRTPSAPLTARSASTSVHQRAVVSESLPPSSTQFVLNHLDDLFPSPSQEAKELLEDIKPRVPPKMPSVLPAGSTVTKSRLSQSINAPSLPMSNLRRETTVAQIPAKVVSDSGLPFFSSQDFYLSSQDVRELESCSTATSTYQESKRNAVTPCCPTMAPVNLGPRWQTPPLKKPPALGNITTPKQAYPPRQATDREAGGCLGIHDKDHVGYPSHVPNGSRPDGFNRLLRQEPGHDSDKSSLTTRNQTVHQRSSSSEKGQSVSKVAANPLGEPQAPCTTGSPPRKRMFSSSGIGADGLCAMERSHRMYQKEQQQASPVVRASGGGVKALQSSGPTTGPPARHTPKLSEEDFLGDDLECVPSQILRMVDDGRHVPLRGLINSLEPPRPPPPCSSGALLKGSRAVMPSDPRSVLGGSQETDYGEFEIGSDELDQLGMFG